MHSFHQKFESSKMQCSNMVWILLPMYYTMRVLQACHMKIPLQNSSAVRDSLNLPHILTNTNFLGKAHQPNTT
jgi:hypothetical protein